MTVIGTKIGEELPAKRGLSEGINGCGERLEQMARMVYIYYYCSFFFSIIQSRDTYYNRHK